VAQSTRKGGGKIPPKHLFLTGKPGVGKTTLIERVIEHYQGPVRGFYTREIREEGRRVGFTLNVIGGERKIFAHITFRTRFRVGRYCVRVDILDDYGVKELEAGIEEGSLIVVDEIGKMELFSTALRETLLQALDSDCRVVATLTKQGSAYREKITGREDVEVIEVTEKNRVSLIDLALARLGNR